MRQNNYKTDKIEILQYALLSIGEGVIITDRLGLVIFLNSSAEKLTGWSKEEAEGKHFNEIFNLIDFLTKEGVETPLQKALDNICAVGLQNYSALVKKDKEVIFVSANFSSVINDNGEIEGAVVVFRDIDRIKHIEEDIRREKNNLKNVLEALPQAILVVDSTAVIRWANNSFIHLFHIDATNIAGIRFGDITNCLNSYENGCGEGHNCQNCQIRKAIKKAVSNNMQDKNIIIQHIVAGNNKVEPLWLRINFIPIVNLNENQILMVIDDITEQKEFEGQLQKSRDVAETASRLKSEFLANMSHELRTPLNGIIGMANLMLSSDLNEEQKDNADVIKTSAFDLLQMINDILDISKIEAGKLKIVQVGFDITSLFDDTAKLYAKIARGKGLGFNRRISPEIPEFLIGDRNRLHQILNNLLSNAIKFTDEGEISFSMETVSRTEETVEVKFSVSDTGIGISEDNKNLLFKRFSQVDSSFTRKYGGTGLGLAISKQLVELMQGNIGVISQPGKGSTFYFTLNFEVDHIKAYNSTRLRNIGEMFF